MSTVQLAIQVKISLTVLSDWVGRTIAWLTVLMVGVTFAVVLLRYGFDAGSIAVQESITYMHAMVFLLGAAYTLRHDDHVRVDIFYHRMSPRGKHIVDLLGTLLLLYPVCLFILIASWDYVMSSWQLRESSHETGGLPFIYLLKTTLLLMPTLLMLQGLAQILESVLALSGKLSAGEAK